MEGDRHVEIFWSSAHHTERLGQRLLFDAGFYATEYEALPLFSADFETELADGRRLLNEVLADSIILLALYKKHYWLIRGDSRTELEQLLVRHADEQNELIDRLAECVHALGGVAVADPRHVATATSVPPTPNGSEEAAAMLYRILEAHRIIIAKMHLVLARLPESFRGVSRLLLSEVLRRHEDESWLVGEQLVGTLTNA